MPAGNSNSIESRNRKAARDSEALLWRALCDINEDDDERKDKGANASVEDIMSQYIEPDCVIVNPLIHPDHSFEALTADSEPYTLTEALSKLKGRSGHSRWTSYHMHKKDPEVAIAQVEMMSVQIMYKVTLIRERHHRRHHHQRDGEGEGEKTLQTVDAFCSSTWRQGAGGDWKLCAQQLVPV